MQACSGIVLPACIVLQAHYTMPTTNDEITLTLTMGGRPEALRKTFSSLKPLFQPEHVVAGNDFRDAACSAILKEFFPDAVEIFPKQHLGHHKIMDAILANVETPYVLHIEDDWLFNENLDLETARQLLVHLPSISQVCFRDISDFHLNSEDASRIERMDLGWTQFARLDKLHEQWHGFTFNPSLMQVQLLREIGSFTCFKKERHISRFLRKKGRFVAFLEPGACVHFGEVSLANPKPKNLLQKIKRKLFG